MSQGIDAMAMGEEDWADVGRELETFQVHRAVGRTLIGFWCLVIYVIGNDAVEFVKSTKILVGNQLGECRDMRSVQGSQ